MLFRSRYSDKSPACLARHFRIHLLFFALPKKNSFCRLPTIGECSASCAGQNLLHLCRATYIHHWYHHIFVPISYSKSAQKSTFALSILTQAASLHFLRIMSKIVNEAKIGHLRSGLLLLLPDIHCLHRRRFSAWPSRLSCSEDAAG